MRTSSNARKVAGQITAYATLILSAQYCTHVFLVLILKDYSRLICWDRGGAVATEPIIHNDEPHLPEFLIRFKDACRQARGCDITVSLPTKDEELEARKLKELADVTSLLSLSISAPFQPSKPNRYIICAPCSRPDIPAGRWTWISIAYDVQRRKRVLLKDSWWVSLQDTTPEGQIYEILHRHGVCHIPLCTQAGDIGNDHYHASRTHEFNNSYFFSSRCASSPLSLSAGHYWPTTSCLQR